MSKEALRLADALDAEFVQGRISNSTGRESAAELRRLHEALETEQEPVAWITDGGKGELWWYQSSKFDEEGNLIGPNPDDIPLYTAPPKREWVGLTLNEAEDFYEKYTDRAELINAIDRFLEEKNA